MVEKINFGDNYWQNLSLKSEKNDNGFPVSIYSVPIQTIKKVRYVIDYNTGKPDIDGQIGDYFQTQNNCWFLSGISALASTKEGQKIIKKSVKKLPNNSIYVNFVGVNQTVMISPETFEAAKKSKCYARGDDDVIALEIATEYYKKTLLDHNAQNAQKHPNTINGKNTSNDINWPLAGGFSSDVMYMLTGKKAETHFNNGNKTPKQITDSIEKIKTHPETFAATCNFKKPKDGVIIHHAYCIKSADDDYVTLINPHDTKKEVKVPINNFLENINSITILKV